MDSPASPRPPARLDPEVAAYSARAPEESRLEQGPARLEFARTQELIQRLAPGPPGVVVDVGGGSGPYALWLAGLGYEVHLVDAVDRLVPGPAPHRPPPRDPSRAAASAMRGSWSSRMASPTW